MKKANVIKNGFYKKYIDDQKSDIQPKDYTQDNVIIVNQKGRNGLVKVLFGAIGAVIRAICYVLLFILSSIGLTAIINEDARKIMFHLFS